MPYEQRPRSKAGAPDMMGPPAPGEDVHPEAAKKLDLRSMDYNAGKASLEPRMPQAMDEGKKLELMRAAAEGMRSEYLKYWIPVAHNYALMQMRDERAELAGEGIITNTVQTLSFTNVPDVNRWKLVLDNLAKAQAAMVDGDIQAGLALYVWADKNTTMQVRRWGKYTGSTAGSLDTAVTVTRVTRDIAFAATASLAAVVLAPVIVPALVGASASSAVTTTVTVGVGAAVGGGTVAVGRGAGDLLGQLIATHEVDWSQVGDNTWDGFKKGAIDGGFAVLSAAPAVNKLAGISPSQLAAQTGSRLRQATVTALRTGAKETTISALQTMSEEALNFATSTDFREKWARDPAAAFAEFQTRLLASGASSFVGGSLTGGIGRGKLDALELERIGQQEVAESVARELGIGGYKTIEGSVREACKEALKDLPVAATQALTAFCVERLQTGEAITAKDISLEVYKLTFGQSLGGATGTVETGAVNLSKALGELKRSE